MYTSNIIIVPPVIGTTCKFNRNSFDMVNCRPWKKLNDSTRMKKKKFVVCNNNLLPAGLSIPSSGVPPPSPNSWKSWVLGMAITLIVPFFRPKFVPFFFFASRIERMIETIETVAETVEKTAEAVAKVAEEISDDMPEGGKIRHAVDFIESLAKETAKDAHLAGDFIDKAQDAEEEIKTLINKEGEEIDESGKETKI